MELFNKDAKELLKAMLDNVDDSYQKSIGYPTYDILNGVAMELETLYLKLESYYRNLDVDNLTGMELTRFVSQHKGIKRKEAVKAKAIINIVGDVALKKGDLFSTDTGIQFEVSEDVKIEGSGKIVVLAALPGALSNVPKGTINNMPVSITGVKSFTSEEAKGGYDEETDTELRDRYYRELQKPATSGNIYHYEKWALEVPGISKAKVFPQEYGPLTVGIYIVDSNGQSPSSELIREVQDYIDPEGTGLGNGQAPIGAKCTIKAALTKEINISLKLTGNSSEEIKSLIRKNIKEYLASTAFTQNYVSYAKIATIINSTSGVIDHSDLRLNNGVSNILLGDKEIAVLGGVSYV